MFVLSRDQSDIANGRRLPFMYTAASQVGVFDDPVRPSMPEVFLAMPEGGVIGMISATRVGFHFSNMFLARKFHEQMYRTEREDVPVGLALMEAKLLIQERLDGRGRHNVRRYSLFGDPATRLARPRYQVELEMADTLQALQEVQVQGRVLDAAGIPATSFDGQAWVQAFDSAVWTKLDHLPYRQVGVPLFRGWLPVVQGRFTAAFRVPKDITYRGEAGRLSAYAWGDGQPTAFGAVEGLVLIGTAEGVGKDEKGPEVSIDMMGQEGFQSGDFIPPGLVLEAVIQDESGINVTGETGHEIVLTIDANAFKVTDLFSTTAGDYRQGSLEYALPALDPGAHVIRLKAWDTFNNSGQVEVEVQVTREGDLVLSDVLFYPNPMQDGGYFTYNLSVRAGAVHIQVFSLAGKQVAELEGETRMGHNQVAWKPASTLANGTYLYRVQARSENGRVAEGTAVIQVMK